ncbi:MAG: hypothetical protein WD598_11520 [Acidimicrobiia bacterium]
MRRRVLAALFLALSAVPVAAAPALAGTSPRDSGGRISVDGGLLIGENELVDGPVVSIDGTVRIEGTATGDVYVIHGDVEITGRARDDIVVLDGDVRVTGGVDGDIAVIGGRAIVATRDSFVGGDIRSTDQPRVARGAQVSGSIDKLGFDGLFGSIMFTLLMFLWLAVTVSTALFGVLYVWLFPTATEASVRASRDVGRTAAWGIGVAIVGPTLAVIALASLIGLPLGLGLGAGFVALSGLAYVTSALCLGRAMIQGTTTGNRIGAFFAGLGILRAAALLPGIGALVGFLATVYGLGVLANAVWRARRVAPSGGATIDSSPTEPTPVVAAELVDEETTHDGAADGDDDELASSGR